MRFLSIPTITSPFGPLPVNTGPATLMKGDVGRLATGPAAGLAVSRCGRVRDFMCGDGGVFGGRAVAQDGKAAAAETAAGDEAAAEGAAVAAAK